MQEKDMSFTKDETEKKGHHKSYQNFEEDLIDESDEESLDLKNNNKADFWTVASTVCGFLMNTIGQGYSVGSIIDSIGHLTPDVVGLSYESLIVGISIGLFLSSTSTAAHFTLNKRHQNVHYEDHKGSINGRIGKDYFKKYGNFSRIQKLIFIGDVIAHGFHSASPAILVSKLIFPKPNIAEIIGTVAIAGTVGFFSGIGHGRTCGNSLKSDNVKTKMEKHRGGDYTPESSWERPQINN